MRNVIIRDETETKKFATDVAQTLKKGDVIECRIEKIGSLKNYVI